MLNEYPLRDRAAQHRQRSYRWLFRNGRLRSAPHGTLVGSYALRMYFAVCVLATALPIIVVAALIYGGYVWLTEDMPSVEQLATLSEFQTTLIYDRNGTLLHELSDPDGGRRIKVNLSDVPHHVIDAAIATEDPRFFDNPGFDLQSIGRAVMQNYESSGIRSGASTITQQLVRNTLLVNEKYEQSYRRKLRELLLSYQVSQRYTKDEILEMYLNEIYYGNQAYGIGAAAWAYFHKDVRDLTLPEATMLAGLPQSPTDYNPLINFQSAKIRQAYVLDQMVKRDLLAEEQAQEVLAAKIEFSPQEVHIKAPHFVYYVKDYLERRYGREQVYTGGWRVYTSLDLNLQDIAERAAREHIAKIRKVNANNAAVVTIKPDTGEILVMVGSVDYWDKSIDGQVNIAVSPRMPGSAIKPFTYVTAFQRGYVPGTQIIDQPTYFWQGPAQGPYAPGNHDGAYHGLLTIRRALAPSMNIAAVMTLNEVGVPAMLETAHRMGLTTMEDPRKYGLSVTLGAGDVKLLDITFAYQGFANGGKQVGEPVPLPQRQPGMREYDPVAVLKIVDSRGNTVYEYHPPEGRQVITPQEAWMITDIISDDDAHAPTYGYNSFLVIDRPAAAKTGTTEFYQDGWTIGYTADLLAGVWTGNSDASRMKGVMGVSGAGVIWHNFMIPAHQYLNVSPRPFAVPPGVARGTQCGSVDWYAVSREPRCYIGPRLTGPAYLKGAPPLPGELQPPPVKPVADWYRPTLKASNPWLPASSQWAPNSGLPAPIVPGLTAPGTIPPSIGTPLPVQPLQAQVQPAPGQPPPALPPAAPAAVAPASAAPARRE